MYYEMNNSMDIIILNHNLLEIYYNYTRNIQKYTKIVLKGRIKAPKLVIG